MTKTFKKMLEEAKKHPAYWHSHALFDVTEQLWQLYTDNGYLTQVEANTWLDYDKISQRTGLSKKRIRGIFEHADNVTVLDLVKLALPFKKKIKITMEDI